jgi:hypothetical protein
VKFGGHSPMRRAGNGADLTRSLAGAPDPGRPRTTGPPGPAPARRRASPTLFDLGSGGLSLLSALAMDTEGSRIGSDRPSSAQGRRCRRTAGTRHPTAMIYMRSYGC